MMSLNNAIIIGLKALKIRANQIQNSEISTQRMAFGNRSEMAALRKLLYEVGANTQDMTEIPPLDPAHKEAYFLRREENKKRAEMGQVLTSPEVTVGVTTDHHD